MRESIKISLMNEWNKREEKKKTTITEQLYMNGGDEYETTKMQFEPG